MEVNFQEMGGDAAEVGFLLGGQRVRSGYEVRGGPDSVTSGRTTARLVLDPLEVGYYLAL